MDDLQVSHDASNGKLTGRPAGSKNKRTPLKVAEIALEVDKKGLEDTRSKYGRSFTPKLACRIIEHLKKVCGPDVEINSDLQAFADSKKPGRVINGPMTAPIEGEWRPYKVSAQVRIGISVDLLGAKPDDTVWTRFGKEGIVTVKEKPETEAP